MNPLYVVTTQQANLSTDSVFVYERQGDLLTLVSSRAVPNVSNSAQNIYASSFSPDNRRVAIAHQGSSFQAHDVSVYRVESDGSLTWLGGLSVLNSSGSQSTRGRSVAWLGNDRLLVANQDSFNDETLSLLSVSTNGSLEVIGRLSTVGATNGNAVVISPEGLAVFAADDGVIRLVDPSGDTLTELATAAPGGTFQDQAVSANLENNLVAASNSNGTHIWDTTGGVLNEAFSGASIIGSSVGLDWGPNDTIHTPTASYSFNGSALIKTADYDSGGSAIAVERAGAQRVHANGSYVRLWSIGDQPNQTDSETLSSSPFSVSVLNPLGPSTPEQKFQASYADASAADPKPTALIRPADVQRSIDTDVSNLKDGPNLYTVEVIFDIGELENLNPYNPTTGKPRVFFVKDDQPGLRQGKNLLLKSYQIRGADPSVPVTCTFWG